MYVKYVILNGFKSYGDRVDIGPFDPHFNAITGPNGSGKSNIMEGILFVLGMSSMHTVRCANLGDLIHTGGNRNQAKVTVVFDNTDKSPNKCPLGYENEDEIVVTRTVEKENVCKYYLNSRKSTKKAIQDMFENVQLNIGSSAPNFMIMQGKITKVVNMKPKDILNMIEESVGANVYQNKRDKALRDIEEKEREIASIQQTLANVVLPSIQNMKKAYDLYLTFEAAKKNRHQLKQDYAIAAYGSYLQIRHQKKKQLQSLRHKEADEENILASYTQQIFEKKSRREEIQKESQRMLAENLDVLDKQLNKERQKLGSYEAAVDTAVRLVKEAEKAISTAKKALNTEEQLVSEYNRKQKSIKDEFNLVNESIIEAKANLAASIERESELQAGKIIGEDGRTLDVGTSLLAVEERIEKIRPQREHERRTLRVEEKDLQETQAKLSRTTSDEQIEKSYRSAEEQLAHLRNQLLRLNIVPEECSAADQEYRAASQRLIEIERQRRQHLNNYPYLDFEYRDPTPNFDRASVHGQFFELFEASNLDRFHNAFEVAVQGALNVVVVDTDATCRAIIKYGDVAMRRKYMPLSQVRGDSNTPSQAELNRRVGSSGKAVFAISLMQYNPQYDMLMKSYCGRAVLCDTMATAKTVANMGCKAVTVEGDVVDPDGGMQGGTRKNLGRLITTCQKLRVLNLERKEIQQKLSDLKARMDNYTRNGEKIRLFEVTIRKLNNIAEERRCTAYASLLAEVNTLKGTICERKFKITEWEKELSKLQAEQKKYRNTLERFEDAKKDSLKTVRADILKWKKAVEAAEKKYQMKKDTFDSLDMELKSKQALLDDYRQDVVNAEKDLDSAKEVEVQKKALLVKARDVFHQKEQEHAGATETYRAYEEESAKLEEEEQALQKQKQRIELDRLKRESVLKEVEQQLKDTKASMRDLASKHPELKLDTNYENLEKPQHSVRICKEKLDDMEKKYENLRTRVDVKVAERLEKTKEKEQSARKHIAILSKNKADIEKAVVVLDKQKAELIRDAYTSVNAEFATMMSTLLPESTAKLVPVTSQDRLEDGVMVHVRLGDIWKESLTELSGGQRSLVALALVLAFCHYQPAPFYVLDEIDAALDLSHTQNIGVLLKTRFQNTQFICISLKDGMYTNADVLFTTKCDNTKSSVVRQCLSGKKDRGRSDNTDKYGREGQRKK